MPAGGSQGRWRDGLPVHGVRDVEEFLREHRGEFKVMMRPFDEGGARLAYITGLDGEWIELESPRKRR